MNTDFIQHRYADRGRTLDDPTIIIPNRSGKTYTIQYGGVGCLHATIVGNIFQLPKTKFGESEGTIFNPDLWYNQCWSKFFSPNAYAIPSKNAKAGRNFIYDSIENEILHRCTGNDMELWSKGLPYKVWHTPIIKINIIRGCDLNNEAMMVVSFRQKSKLKYGVLTWQNCD